ncbi:MAG: hypothetical protein KatS3mg060_1741 [Dehalococcoidia bacterium]|nr:MAG: hypothetical protein KatS3mg060_1741 [Dehalococcoidia bacterium]
MISPAKPRLLTADEFQRMGELGTFCAEDRLELHDGVIVEMAARGKQHMLRLGRIASGFDSGIGQRAFLQAQTDMRVSETQDFVPDLVLYRPESAAYFLEVGFRAQDALLVIEVAESTLALDSGDKARAYAAAGIPDYWVADLNGDRLMVRRDPASDGYRSMVASLRGGTVAPLALPDLALPVEAFLGPATEPGS